MREKKEYPKMANRSYLYSINNSIRGISECDFKIPLSYKILVSQDARIVDSIIWEYSDPIAIKGDYVKGRKKLYDFLDRLAREDIFDDIKLAQAIAKTTVFLNSKENEKDLFHLENGEIYEMTDEDSLGQNRAFFEDEILRIDDVILDAIAQLHMLKRETSIENMWNLIGIGYWSNVLFYDFSEATEDKPAVAEPVNADPYAKEKEAAEKSECRYCGGKLRIKNWECKTCGKGNLMVCNKCGGEIGSLSNKCKVCKKSVDECFYCGGKMKMDFKLTDFLCQSCGRIRKY